MQKIILEIKNLSKIYSKGRQLSKVLDHVNLNIYQGEVLALLGVNGAGKTTLSSILATLHPPSSGEVFFNNESIYKKLSQYRQILGYCPQKPNLDKDLTVVENLIYAGKYFLLSKKEILRKTIYLLKQLDLEKYEKYDVEDLSGGCKQRLLIARALMHDPKILILDEPTVGLDSNIRRHLWEVIRQLKYHGVTIILTTHYLEEAEELADRVCVLNKGRVVLTESIGLLKEKTHKDSLEEIFLSMTELFEENQNTESKDE